MNHYLCPVCGFDGMIDPPKDFNICPCCGTEFGYEDHILTHGELRDMWIEEGCKWFSDYTTPPENWNPQDQLKNVCKK